MALIKSISGIRGTIGGKPGDNLTPLDIVKFVSAYGVWIKECTTNKSPLVVIGRDARISGQMVESIAIGALTGMGIAVVNAGLATTPTIEMAVPMIKADGGIIITASHNPKQWNALKLLNSKGEFITANDGKRILELAASDAFTYAEVNKIGTIVCDDSFTKKHIDEIVKLNLVDVEAISKAGFKIAVDAVNSVGGIAIPELLKALGVEHIIELYCEPNGYFPHNPEPLAENLTEISKTVVENNADVGFVVDPDVDRLAIVNEDGSMFGEEYTLVCVADYVLQNIKGNTVSNMSSSRALRDITEKHGGQYSSAAVGEVNVVAQMKKVNAVIGGEGNGGVIYPELHTGRDALVGIALFLTYLAKKKIKCSELRAQYPNYFISKNKAELPQGVDVDALLLKIKQKYENKATNISTADGVKIEFNDEWVHLRKSNTEPIVRIYSESKSRERADELAQEIIKQIEF